jgi:hypothetical protein
MRMVSWRGRAARYERVVAMFVRFLKLEGVAIAIEGGVKRLRRGRSE